MSARGYSEKDFEPVRKASVTNPEDFDGDILNTIPTESKEEKNPRLKRLADVVKETTKRAMEIKELYTGWVRDYLDTCKNKEVFFTVDITEPVSNKSSIHFSEPEMIYDITLGIGKYQEEVGDALPVHFIKIKVCSKDRVNYLVSYQLKVDNPEELLQGLGVTKEPVLMSVNLNKEDLFKLFDELTKEENL